MRGHPTPGLLASGRQVLLLAVAALLCASAALAIGILLLGDFGETEGRILATTACLAAYGVLALPPVILLDQRRLRPLAVAGLLLGAGSAALAVAAIWTDGPSDTHGDAIGTLTVLALAVTQVSALALRRRGRDPALVRGLFAASCALAAVLAAMVIALLWAEIDSSGFGRVLGALVVLDLLAVALQPTLARARPAGARIALRLVLEPNETRDVALVAPDVATAAARAIRDVERNGRRLVSLEVGGRPEHSSDR